MEAFDTVRLLFQVSSVTNTERIQQVLVSCVSFLQESVQSKKYYTIVLGNLFEILDHIFTFNKNRLLQSPNPDKEVDFTQEFEKLQGLDTLETIQVEIKDEATYQSVQELLQKFFECEGMPAADFTAAPMQTVNFNI